MARKDKGLGKLPVIDPNLQISFYYRLQSLRKFYLIDRIRNLRSTENKTFKDMLASRLGIRM